MLAVPVGLSMLFVAACASEGPYADRISDAQENATSSFEREVLADGEITPAEYDDATRRYVDCVNAELAAEFPPGLTAEKNELGLYGFVGPDVEEARAAEFEAMIGRLEVECAAGTTQYVALLYNDMVFSPEGKPYDVMVVECLAAAGITGAGYDEDNLAADLAADLQMVPVGPDGMEVEYDRAAATDVDLTQPDAIACVEMPAAAVADGS